METKHDQSRASVDAEAWKPQGVEVILAEVRSLVEDHSFFLRSFHKMFSFDANLALQDYLQPISDAKRERTVAIWSALSS